MGQTFVYANLHLREFFTCWPLDTDSKFFCNSCNKPGVVFELLTVVGMQQGGTAEVPAKPAIRMSQKKYDELLAKWVGRWGGHPCGQIGEYTKRETFALLFPEQADRLAFLVASEKDLDPTYEGENKLARPLSWIGAKFTDITKDVVKLATAVGLNPPLPESVYELARSLEPFLQNRLLFDWRRARCHPADLRWMHPSDLEAYLGEAKTMAELNKLKAVFRGCTLLPVHERILQHFVSPEIPHYGTLQTSGKRAKYSSLHADEMRRRAYGDWGMTPEEKAAYETGAQQFRRLPEPPISTPLPQYLTPRDHNPDAVPEDQLRHLVLGPGDQPKHGH